MQKTFVDDTHACNPILRWAGSKKRQFRSYTAHFPERFDRYVEPFAGSAAFVFLTGRTSVINDINQDVIDLYTAMATNLDAVYAAFIAFPRTSEAYYEARTRLKNMPRGAERCAYFLFLNRNCFNGIYRDNSRGDFNVPFSASRVPLYPSYDSFNRASMLLRKCKLLSLDFEDACRVVVSEGDFVFLDPPYYSDQRRVFREYSATGFGPIDVERLKATLLEINRRGARFLLSFPLGSQGESLAQGWKYHIVPVRRTVAGNPSSRRSESELLVANYVI